MKTYLRVALLCGAAALIAPGLAGAQVVQQRDSSGSPHGANSNIPEVQRNPGNAVGSTSDSGSSRDGTRGNPPSTVTGRAVDRLQGETPRPDGTPGNPPGTAAGRALDSLTGSDRGGGSSGSGGSSPTR